MVKLEKLHRYTGGMEILDDFVSYLADRNKNEDESSGEECEDDDAVGLTHVGTAVYDELRKHFNHHHDKLWNVTAGKVVGHVHQTPRDGWVRETEYPPSGHDDWFPEKMAEILSRTEVWCDVMSLAPPDGLFMTKIHEALIKVAYHAKGKKKPVIIRMMFGNIPGLPVDCTKVMKHLTKDLPTDANIQLWVGAWRRGASWNHAKMIAVDGLYLHTGGHNMWHKHYLAQKPVHDLSIELEGPVAQAGHLFANEQWTFIEYKQDTLCGKFVNELPDNMILMAKTRVAVTEWPPHKASTFPPKYQRRLVPKRTKQADHVPIITIGRYGTLYPKVRPSDDAIIAMLGSAKQSVRLALQDLGPVCVPNTKLPLPNCVWPKQYLACLARVLYDKHVDVEIALSNPHSIPGGLSATEANYGNGWTCVDVAAEIIKSIQQQFPTASDSSLRKIVAENLRVCFIRQKHGNRYEDGNTVGMHAKHFIVDDVATYIGSQNLYICDLAEWGVIIDHKATTRQIMDDYWRPMWRSSYTGTDCCVQNVMDGLKIDRDQTAPPNHPNLNKKTGVYRAYGPICMDYYNEEDEEE